MKHTILFLLLASCTAWAETNELVAVIQSNGFVSVSGLATVPPCGMLGKWTELPSKSSPDYLTRHFMFLVPQQAPVMELYLTRPQTTPKSNAGFEIGLVQGYVNGFAGKAGFKADAVVFEDNKIGAEKIKRCKVKLAREPKALWVYAYIYTRPTSLVFLTVRPDPDAQPTIERYLATVQFH